MIGSSRRGNIHLSEEEFRKYKTAIEHLDLEAERSKKLLKTELEHRLNPEKTELLELLHFELPPSHRDRHTDEGTLKDNSWKFAWYESAIRLIFNSSKEMKDWDMKDQSQMMDRGIKETINYIYNTLSENGINPPDTPAFPDLKGKLDKETRDFLEIVVPHGNLDDQTDDTHRTTLYLVRNLIITLQLQDVLRLFRVDIGKLKKNL